MQDEVVQYLPHTELEIHPRNMRKIYPAQDVEQMAISIEARGILQPLTGVSGPNGKILTVVGNLRLTAARTLGKDAPLIPVIIRDREEENQLLDMAAENGIRFDPDVVSEGEHYKTLLAQPGMTLTRLSRETGLAVATIKNRLAWAELEPSTQQLGMEGKLPKLAAEHLLLIPAGELRVETARKLARTRARLKTVKATCRRVAAALERQENTNLAFQDDDGPAVGLVAGKQPMPNNGVTATMKEMRAAAGAACSVCLVHDDLGVAEPAWAILIHGASETCDRCNLRQVRSYCNECPMTQFLRRVCREMVRQEKGGAPHERF